MKEAKTKLAGAPQSNLIYADKVIGIGLGAAVSKIVLGLEAPGAEEDSPSTTLVLPTHALLDLVELVNKTISNNDSLRNALLEQWDQLSQRFGRVNEDGPVLEQSKTKRISKE